MQTELIIVSEYCHKCHIEPSFIEMLEEGGLITVRTEAGEHYLLVSELPNVERYSRMYFDLSINMEGDELVLAPFQGPIACTRIRFGRGVCGTAWKEAQTLIVPDVEQFPGHIACSSNSKSEIVVPVIKEGNVIGVLDIDSDTLNSFDETDARYLREICTYIG